ncbi:helix-turn-helix transcriptional regulator [Ligilactobacillus sp. WILCCON 0076]|uniref:Helix-turn-helix transcriptional regulator n=1 Tax=Ligilactobacillus ubinensis TaxID=2876789 RepID=A0A9X2FM42_9LACO|nr:helix-turn-helix domain-containing protein [Ligilactobacillus ubinensis]MCP0887770.1 helix-turn-helix transcriptional regulator [Ligilactobacillus ubinensis]
MHSHIKKVLVNFNLATQISVLVYSYERDLLLSLPGKINSDSFLILTKDIVFPQNNNYRNYIFHNDSYISLIDLGIEQKKIIILGQTEFSQQSNDFNSSFPNIMLKKFQSVSNLVYYSIFFKWPSQTEPIHLSDSLLDGESYNSLDNRRLEKNFHNNYLFEKSMLKTIERGQNDKFPQALHAYMESGSPGEMNYSNALRNNKDLAIAALTIFTRAAIKGGIPAEGALSLSDNISQNIEKLTEITDIEDLILKIGMLFIERVQNTQKASTTNPVVYSVINYIYQHLNSKIKISDIAVKLNYSPNYISKIFKKETNKTITQYINDQKIQEVKSQLAYTDKTISQISEDLGFSDQGYLTRLFKKSTGVSPFFFRQEHSI